LTLGYQEDGNFPNRSNEYIQSDHLVAGLEFIPTLQTRITVGEAFNKVYSNYPISTTTGISLANQGGDFGQSATNTRSTSTKGP
jgi:hypothetical protein